MINFIIFEKENKRKELYLKIIRKFLYTSSDYYQIYDFNIYNKENIKKMQKIEGQKIYLLNSDIAGKSGLDIARMIRTDGDILSPIIMFTDNMKTCIPKYTKNTLILNIIYKDDDLIKELWESLITSYKILTKYAVLTFSFFDEVFRIPYDDIYYIEKNIHDDSVTIYTRDDSYTNYISIKRLEKQMIKDPRFFRSHRSCILNLFNISSYNRKDNIVIFNNGMQTKLVCRTKKKILAERLLIDSKFEEVPK